ncbi:EamA/RhaT family transporter [Hydrogenovibrio sp. SC-1]|uniref:DMT family transporter n=1 Tax=Hydrogenovibrio sp. SC-1 TaxID=2065820 RepID=UPI000C7B7AFB|nr:DMT family transporter [Hydrogenovibrio sp. SC-1]PLA74170.1 EamA/RhaT family transporter [Hydrogenovibrio sp. SC-1]
MQITWIAYFSVVLIWATTPLAIQWSGQTDWFIGISARILISAILIIPVILWFSRQRFSLAPRDLKVYFSASLGILGGMTPMYYAAQTMPSGWMSLIFGLTPILTGFFASFLLDGFKMSFSKYVGSLVSLMGLMVIFYPQLAFDSLDRYPQLGLGIALAAFAALNHSLSTVLVKKTNHGLPNTHLVAAAVWISSLCYLLFQPSYLTELPLLPTQSLLAIAYLGIFGSLVGYILYYYVLKRMDAIRLGLITLIAPVMAILIGYYFNNEPLNISIASGVGLVIIGLILFEFGHHLTQENFRLLMGRRFF